MLVDWDPILVRIGPLAIRWYGVFMAASMAIGLYYMVKHGRRRGYEEDFLYTLSALVIAGGVVGARVVYVLTNWGDYFRPGVPWTEVFRVDHGGLSLHGALLGGALTLWWSLRRSFAEPVWPHFNRLLDLMVPGIAVGYALVRIGNIFNQEVLGNPTTALPFPRHPLQLYASAAGLALLLLHNRLARRQPPAGYLFWSFLYYYQWWRLLIEESLREVPIAVPVYANTSYGIEVITVTQVATWPLLIAAWWLRRKSSRDGIPARWEEPAPRDDASQDEEPGDEAEEVLPAPREQQPVGVAGTGPVQTGTGPTPGDQPLDSGEDSPSRPRADGPASG